MPSYPPSFTTEKVQGKKVKHEIIVPAWNDIIHLVPKATYTEREFALMRDITTQVDVWGRSLSATADYFGLSFAETQSLLQKSHEYQEDVERTKQKAYDIKKSPTPEFFGNIGTIMTAIDDIQDFTTTVGVISRILGRVFKPAQYLAIGAFTVGEYLNQLSLLRGLTGPEKAVVCRLVRDLKETSTKTTIKADVSKRMKRLFPSKGEIIEMLQTTDQLFGVGISLGPLVGLAQDLYFGAFEGATIRFREWTISAREKRVIQDFYDVTTLPTDIENVLFPDVGRWAESAANVITAGEYVEWADYAKSLLTSIETGLVTRGKGVKDAFVSIWETMSGKKFTNKKHSSVETHLLLSGLGVDPYRLDNWPVPGLGAEATIQEIVDAYSKQSQKTYHYWRNKLGVSDEGLFLDACVKEIGLHAAAMFCDDNGVITESLDPYSLIYIHALESGLNPPADTPPEKFTAWASFIKDQIDYYHIPAPNLKILQEAFSRFF